MEVRVAKRSLKGAKNIVEGEIILVDKEKVEAKGLPTDQGVLEVGGEMATKLKAKRPQSEAQKAHTQRLVELNKARKQKRLEQPELEHTFTVPETIPEGKVLIKVKPNQNTRTAVRQELLDHLKLMNDKLQELDAKVSMRTVPANEPRNEIVQPEPQPKQEPPKGRKPRKPRKPVESEDTTDLEETELDTDVEESVHRKINKRLNSLKQIESQLQNTNKYVARGLTVF